MFSVFVHEVFRVVLMVVTLLLVRRATMLRLPVCDRTRSMLDVGATGQVFRNSRRFVPVVFVTRLQVSVAPLATRWQAFDGTGVDVIRQWVANILAALLNVKLVPNVVTPVL